MLPLLHTLIPGPASTALMQRLRRVESRNVTFTDEGFPIFWERSEGVNVWDVDGNRFLDFTSAFGVCGLGHNCPALTDAAFAQATRLVHAMGDVHPTEVKVQLCEKLSALTFERWGVGRGRVLLGNSGFEAIEAALKTALLATGRAGVIGFEGGYHGLGYGTLAASGMSFFSEPFRSQVAQFASLLPFPRQDSDVAALELALQRELARNRVGAILVEPIQGRGGDVVPPDTFLPLLRAACDRHGVLLVLDEIYTGLNRTGDLFACDHAAVVPDIICLGKALTGGLPLSACVGRESVMNAWPESAGEALHTSTFLGNPMAAAMAVESLRLHALDETRAQVRAAGDYLRRVLEKAAPSHSVRGRGLLLGLDLPGAPGVAGAAMKHALRYGLILLGGGPAGDVLSFTPPFAIAHEEMELAGDWLQEYLMSLPGSIS